MISFDWKIYYINWLKQFQARENEAYIKVIKNE